MCRSVRQHSGQLSTPESNFAMPGGSDLNIMGMGIMGTRSSPSIVTEAWVKKGSNGKTHQPQWLLSVT